MSCALAGGLVIRWLLRDYRTVDTQVFLLPWYEYARAHGVDALSAAFTNYAPFYSYLLVAVARLDGLAPPLVLIKAVSWGFELASAALAYGVVRAAGASATRASFAFAAVWLAPTVLFNGAAWGQCDAMWSAMLLLAVLLYLRGRDGAPAFGLAFAMKAQAVFLGPFVLGLILRRRVRPWSLIALPAVYLLVAVPVLVAGRPLLEVVRIYVDQAGAFQVLTANAGSLWAMLAPVVPFSAGLPVALGLSAVGGLLLAWIVARSDLDEPGILLLSAATALLATPFLLPLMHERYFFAFETMAIVLAAVQPAYLSVAILAQASGLACYLAYDRVNPVSVPVAAAVNGYLLWTLLDRLLKAPRPVTLKRPPQ